MSRQASYRQEGDRIERNYEKAPVTVALANVISSIACARITPNRLGLSAGPSLGSKARRLEDLATEVCGAAQEGYNLNTGEVLDLLDAVADILQGRR